MTAGDFIIERGATESFGIVLSCGGITVDILWVGGSTTRYRHLDGRKIEVIKNDDPRLDAHTRDHLLGEYNDAKAERRRGARIRRGQVSPSG